MAAFAINATRVALLCASVSILPLAALSQALDETGAVILPPLTLNEGDDDANSTVAGVNSSGTKLATDALDTAATVSVTTQKEIRQRGAESLETILAYTSGVFVNEFGSDLRYDNYRIRGFDATSQGLYRNGLPLRGFNFIVPRIEPYAVDRVEVLKGSNSSLFGLAQPGGLVNVITKRPTEERFREVYTTLGENHVELGFDFSDRFTQDSDWSYRLTVKYQDSESSFRFSNDDRLYVGAAVSWRPSERTDLTFLASYYERTGTPGTPLPPGQPLDPDTFLGEPGFNRFDSVEWSIGYLLTHNFGGGLTFRSAGRYLTEDLVYEQLFAVTPAGRTPFQVFGNSQQFVVDNQLQYDTSFGDVQSRSLLGFEFSTFEGNDFVSNGTAPPVDFFNPVYTGRASITLTPLQQNDAYLESWGVYVQQEFTLGDRVILTLGGRYDEADVQQFDPLATIPDKRGSLSEFTYRAGLVTRITDGLSLYANYAQSVQPSLSAADFEPSEGEQFEFGVKYRPDTFNGLFTLAYFNLTQTNLVTQLNPVLQTVLDAEVRGIEFEGRFEIDENWSGLVSYAVMDSEATQALNGAPLTNPGFPPPRVPDQLFAAWLNYTLPGQGRRGDMNFGAGVRYVGKSFGNINGSDPVGDYTLVDAAFSYDVTDRTVFQINATNLFDKRAVTTEFLGQENIAEGRTIRFTLRHTF